MLNKPTPVSEYRYIESHEETKSPDEELLALIERIFAAFKRQYKLIIFFSVLGIVLGILYIAGAQPLYTATTQVLIDDQDVGNSGSSNAGSLTKGFDMAKIDSQVEVIRSDRIAMSVVEKLKLYENNEFLNARGTIFSKGISALKSLASLKFLTPKPELTSNQIELRKLRALYILGANLEVSRRGVTYVLEVSFTSPSRNEAATIANAFAEAYLLDQLESKYEATRRASSWLQERIQELKEKSLASDLAVQKFRADHNLIAAEGFLVGEKQLADLSGQLMIAKSETAQAKAKFDRIEQIIASDQMDAAVSEALNNPVIASFRAKYLDASKRYSEISKKLGPNHVQSQKLKNDMAEYQRVIFDELGRIAESYKSQLEIARSREKSLGESMSDLLGENAESNETMVTLRELQRESDTYRTLYQNFLQRYQEAVQQQSFPVTKARVISPARAPGNPSHPRKKLVLVLSMVLGCFMGTGFGAYREYRDRGVRTSEQVRNNLKLEYLGILPMLKSRKLKDNGRSKAAVTEEDRRTISVRESVMRQTLDAPLSGYSESLRAAKIASDLMLGDKKCKLVGTVSIYPAEGKSTVSKNYASLLASLGSKTLLIDCDLRNPGLTRGVAEKADTGLLDVLLEEKDLKSVLMVEQETGLFVLPTVIKQRISHTGELLTSPNMKRMLQEASEVFDYIIFDLPPLVPVVDVRAILGQLDAFLFVVEWGKTPRHTIRNTLSQDDRLREKCLGVLLNKVDTAAQKLYEPSAHEGYKRSSSYSNMYGE